MVEHFTQWICSSCDIYSFSLPVEHFNQHNSASPPPRIRFHKHEYICWASGPEKGVGGGLVMGYTLILHIWVWSVYVLYAHTHMHKTCDHFCGSAAPNYAAIATQSVINGFNYIICLPLFNETMKICRLLWSRTMPRRINGFMASRICVWCWCEYYDALVLGGPHDLC